MYNRVGEYTNRLPTARWIPITHNFLIRFFHRITLTFFYWYHDVRRHHSFRRCHLPFRQEDLLRLPASLTLTRFDSNDANEA
jgi:hypothetical protein